MNEAPCMSEDHLVYISGRGYVKIKDLKPDDVVTSVVDGKTVSVKVSDIRTVGLEKKEVK